MAKKYSKIKIPGKGSFGIYEEKSERIIIRAKELFHLYPYYDALINGGGFDGWTPSFILPGRECLQIEK